MSDAPYRPAHLSVSAVELYARCPAAFRRRYVERISDPPTPAMAFGRVMAQALETLHRGGDGDLAFLQTYLAQETELVAATGQRITPPLTHGLALLQLYRQQGIAQGEPELYFRLPLPDRDAVPVDLVGYLDLAGQAEIVEFKTAAGGWSQGRCDASNQAHVYRWAYTQLFHRKPQHVRFLVFSTRRVALDEYRTYPSGADLHAFELLAAAVWRGIRDGVYPSRCGRCPACQEVTMGERGARRPERMVDLEIEL